MNEIQLAINRYLHNDKRRHRSTSSKAAAPSPSIHNSQRLNYNPSPYKQTNNNNSSFGIVNGSIRSNATVRTAMISTTAAITKGTTNQIRVGEQSGQRHHQHLQQQARNPFHRPTRLIRQQTLMSNFQAPEPAAAAARKSNESDNKTNTQSDEANLVAQSDATTCGESGGGGATIELAGERWMKQSLDQHNDNNTPERGRAPERPQSASSAGLSQSSPSSSPTTMKRTITPKQSKKARINR